MKIALLGPRYAGKTAYFSGLYSMFRNRVAMQKLSGEELQHYLSIYGTQRANFQLSIFDYSQEKILSEYSQMLRSRPVVWPDSTLSMDKTTVTCRFRFDDVSINRTQNSTNFEREFTIFDPAGSVVQGFHEDGESIKNELLTCDVCMVFIPSDILLDAVEMDDADALQHDLGLGIVTEIIQATQKKLNERDDIFPVCIVISKGDLLRDGDIQRINNMLYNNFIIPYSEENPNLMLCVCPISVINPNTGTFKGKNLEWPFIFAAGGTIFRNSVALARDASDVRFKADQAKTLAENLKKESWWTRLKTYVADGVRVGALEEQVKQYRSSHGRLIEAAQDDRDFAKNLWTSLAIEGKARNVVVMMDGKTIDPLELF